MALVLIVEDNAMNRKLMRDILEIRFEVVEAVSAEEALQQLAALQPDLIVMDLQLPGMDGLALTRRLKRECATKSIPIVAVSAHAMKQNIDEALACGCAAYITKPLVDDPFDLADRLARLASPA